MRTYRSEYERFWSKAIPEPMSGCWLWMGYISANGYGSFTTSTDTPEWAHRAAWRLTHGSVPEGIWVLHKCDNRACVNPDHLFLGTNSDNVADMVAKGRNLRGERQNGATITDAMARTILDLAARGESRKEIARRYGISYANVCNVVAGRTFAHLDHSSPAMFTT